ncbi:MAG: GNAT family N-acetyltransferase [Phycisphaerales bacterium]
MSAGPVIETPRLVLRPISMGDLDEEAAMLADPRVVRYITGGVPRPRERVIAGIERSLHFWRTRGVGMFNVRTHDGAFVGDGLLVPIRHSGVPADRHHDPESYGPDIEVGYRLAHAHWGRGYATEVARAIVAFAMDDHAGPRLERVIGVTDPANEASKRVLVKAGLAYVGESEAYYDQTVSLYERTR